MSSALAIILAAGMAVGNGPEKVSGEREQWLDLRGEWEGTLMHGIGQGSILIREGIWCLNNMTDEGRGELRVGRGESRWLGIYRQDGDRLIICNREARQGRPKWSVSEITPGLTCLGPTLNNTLGLQTLKELDQLLAVKFPGERARVPVGQRLVQA
jgi:hypothetical protein